MTSLFNTIFYQPLFNLLVLIYNVIPGHDIGVAIILLTVVIKFVLYPLSLKSIKSQKALQDLQPKIDALKKQYKDQKEKLAAEMMNLYKAEKVSPFSSCLPLLIQFPFLIAVYWVFRNGLISDDMSILYSFIANPGQLNAVAFGFLDLSQPNIILAVLAGGSQFWQVKMLSTKKPEIKSDGSKDEGMAAIMNKQMTFFMPIMTVMIGLGLPGGLMLYWMITSLFTVGQQYFGFSKKEPEVEVIDKPSNNNEITKV